MDIDFITIIPMIILAICLIGIIIIAIKVWNVLSQDKRDLFALHLYSLVKSIYEKYTNDGKLDSDEIKEIVEEMKILLADLQGRTLEDLDEEFPTKPNNETKL